jgi:hypothetical protein
MALGTVLWIVGGIASHCTVAALAIAWGRAHPKAAAVVAAGVAKVEGKI